MNSCIVPVINKDTDGDDRWISIHNRFISECQLSDPDVIFIGDGILESLQYTETWDQYFAPMHCLNFSIRNDKVENTLWRIQNGELDHVKPKAAVIHVGTNNINNTPEEVSEGILKIIETIREKLPDVYIILPNLLPRGQFPNKLREQNDEINKLIYDKVNGMKKVQTVRIDKGLINADGTISHHDMFDYLHLTNAGSKKAFEPVYDLLTQILLENERNVDLLTPSE